MYSRNKTSELTQYLLQHLGPLESSDPKESGKQRHGRSHRTDIIDLVNRKLVQRGEKIISVGDELPRWAQHQVVAASRIRFKGRKFDTRTRKMVTDSVASYDTKYKSSFNTDLPPERTIVRQILEEVGDERFAHPGITNLVLEGSKWK